MSVATVCRSGRLGRGEAVAPRDLLVPVTASETLPGKQAMGEVKGA